MSRPFPAPWTVQQRRRVLGTCPPAPHLAARSAPGRHLGPGWGAGRNRVHPSLTDPGYPHAGSRRSRHGRTVWRLVCVQH